MSIVRGELHGSEDGERYEHGLGTSTVYSHNVANGKNWNNGNDMEDKQGVTKKSDYNEQNSSVQHNLSNIGSPSSAQSYTVSPQKLSSNGRRKSGGDRSQLNRNRKTSNTPKSAINVPFRILFLGFGLVFLLTLSFVHVILIDQMHLEQNHSLPISNNLRVKRISRGAHFGPLFHLGFSYQPVERRMDYNDLPSIILSQNDKNDDYRKHQQPYHQLLRRNIKEELPEKDSFPVLKFQPMILTPDDEKKFDYGGINLTSVESFEDGRVIKKDKEAMNGHIWTKEELKEFKSKYVDSYYAFDDDIVRSKHFHNEDCKRTAWHKLYFPTCNNFHEIDLIKNGRKLGSGYYRTVWSLDGSLNEKYVLKGSKYKHPTTTAFYEFTRMDALVMERLTDSARIVDIYGHCALGVITEKLDYDVESDIIPGSGQPDKINGLGDKYEVKPQNYYKPTEKLELALQMAECIAALHGFKDGVIVHDDIQLSQFLIGNNGQLKLNDFNRAEIMLFDAKEEVYCKYKNGGVYGNYRAPEEFMDHRLDEKIDVWSMGNNIYALLTGLWVYYEADDDKTVHQLAIDGKLPYVDPRYETSSFAERKLVNIMKRCWTYDPKRRADIFEVVEYLREAVKENRMKQEKRTNA